MRFGARFFKQNWHYLLIVLPAFSAGFALRYYIQYRQENPRTHTPTKISEYKNEGGGGEYYGSASSLNRGVASGAKSAKGKVLENKAAERSDSLPKNKKGSASPSEAGAGAAAAALKEMISQEGGPLAQASAAAPIVSPSLIPAAAPSAMPESFAAVDMPEEKMVSDDGTCRSYEGHGDASDRIAIDQKDWDKVMDQYHEAKRDLLVWLEKRKAAFSQKTYDHMSNLVKNLKIQRPPNPEEPDLSWRGIGVYVKTPDGKNLMRMGGGFVNLSKKDATRAKFELARLIAHTWSPCDLKKENLGEPWKELLDCMKVVEDDACGKRTFSEAGWAFSSILASITDPPGCTLPALKDPQIASCLKVLDTSKFSRRPWEPIKIDPPKYTQAKR